MLWLFVDSGNMAWWLFIFLCTGPTSSGPNVWRGARLNSGWPGFSASPSAPGPAALGAAFELFAFAFAEGADAFGATPKGLAAGAFAAEAVVGSRSDAFLAAAALAEAAASRRRFSSCAFTPSLAAEMPFVCAIAGRFETGIVGCRNQMRIQNTGVGKSGRVGEHETRANILRQTRPPGDGIPF